MKNLNNSILTIGVKSVVKGTPEYLEMADRVQHAIDHHGINIYNGSDETEEVPFISGIEQVYPEYVRGSEEWTDEFYGWVGSDSTIVIYFDRIAEHQRESVLRQYMADSTVECWLANIDRFNTHDVMAVHIDDSDGSWYEQIITRTK